MFVVYVIGMVIKSPTTQQGYRIARVLKRDNVEYSLTGARNVDAP